MVDVLFPLWELLVLLNFVLAGIVLLMGSIAVTVVSTSAPRADMTGIERFASRLVSNRTSVLACCATNPPRSAQRLFQEHQVAARETGRAVRGLFSGPRIAAVVGLCLGAAQLFVILVASMPWEAGNPWWAVGSAIVILDFMLLVAVRGGEIWGWRHRASFEQQLVRILLSALKRGSRGSTTWTVALEHAGAVEELLFSRFHGRRQAPSTTLAEQQWRAQITPIVFAIAAAKAEAGGHAAAAPDAWLRDIIDDAAGLLYRRPRRCNEVPPVMMRTRRWNSQLHAGWMLILICGTAVAYFGAMVLLDLQHEAPSEFRFGWDWLWTWPTQAAGLVTAASVIVAFAKRVAAGGSAPL